MNGFQVVWGARQQHVESTLKAQQLITCMVNILGLRFQQTYTVVHFMQNVEFTNI